jgi:hypothetical protein
MVILLAALAGAADETAPGLSWYTLRTEHFAIHYSTSRDGLVDGETMAQRLADVADEVWLDVCGQLGWFVAERVHVVVLDHTDDVEGYAIPSWDLVVTSSSPGMHLPRSRGHVEWPSDVLAHEFAHVVAAKRARFFSEATDLGVQLTVYGSGDFGEAGGEVSLGQEVPAWWSEGGAELWAEGAGATVWTAARDHHLRATVLDDRLLPKATWHTYEDKDAWGDAERIYAQGHGFGRWLRDRYGRDIYAELAEAASHRASPSYERLLQQVTGEPAEALMAAFADEMSAHYREQVASIEAAGRVEGREMHLGEGSDWASLKLSRRDRHDLLPPDKRRKQRERGGTWQIAPRYSSDGRWYGVNVGGWLGLRRVDEEFWLPFRGDGPKGTGPAAWLPTSLGHSFDFVDGTDEVIVVADEDKWRAGASRGRELTALYRVDLSEPLPEGWRRRFQKIPDTERGYAPAVAPDGRLAFARPSEIIVGDRVVMNHNETWVQGIDWSADGTTLVVAMQRHAQSDLWLLDVASGDLTALTWDAWQESDPWWSDDGWIYYSSDVDGVIDIFRIRPDDRRVERVTRVVGAAVSPSVTPKGNLIYSEGTSYGWQARGLARELWSGHEVSHQVPTPPRDTDEYWEPVIRRGETEKYRAARNMLPVTTAPLFRLDTAPTPALLGGVYVQVRDALNRHRIEGTALVGDQVYARAGWTVRMGRPKVGLWASHLSHRTAPVEQSRVGIRLTVPVREHVELVADVIGWRHAGDTSAYGLRVVAGADLGDAEELTEVHPQGAATSLRVEQGFTARSLGEGYRFLRPQGHAEAWLGLRGLGLSGHRLQLVADGAWTSIVVEPLEQVGAGGAHGTAWFPQQLEDSFRLPGYLPYSQVGGTVAVGRALWRFPVVPRIRKRLGPLYVSGLYAGLGGGTGVIVSDTAIVLPEAEAELRLFTEMFGSDWNHRLGVGYGSGVNGGFRLALAIGAGW